MFKKLAFISVCFLLEVISFKANAISDGGISKVYMGEGKFSLSIYSDPFTNQPMAVAPCDVETQSNKLVSTSISINRAVPLPIDGNYPIDNCGTTKWYRTKVATLTPIPGELLAGSNNSITQGLLDLGEYQYRYQSCTASGYCQGYSTPLTITVQPITKPEQLLLQTPSNSSVELTWSLPNRISLRDQDSVVEQSVNGAAWTKVYVGKQTSIILPTSVGQYQFRIKTCSFASCSDYALSNSINRSGGTIEQLNYSIHKDANGNIYLVRPATFIPISGDIFIPLFIADKGNVIVMTKNGASWSLTEITYEEFIALQTNIVREASVRYENLTGNTSLDLIISLSGNFADSIVVNDINATTHEATYWDCSESVCVVAGSPEAVPAVQVAPIPSINVASSSVGITSGDFRVDESGAATFNMPLSFPVGIASVTPQMSLSYNSNSGNGELGIGSSIVGLSSITRCRSTFEQDGVSGTLTLTKADRFCINGRKLVLKKNTGEYGAAGSEYATEVDSFISVVAVGSSGNGPDHFEVTHKDGRFETYGQAGNSQLFGFDGDTIETWYLSSQQDNLKLDDNKISYCYINGGLNCRSTSMLAGNNEILIDTISYSGNTVEFNYQHRTDVSQGYSLGTLKEQTLRLEDVLVKNHNNVPLTKYLTSYDYNVASGFSQLLSLVQCNGSGNSCLQPIRFNWKPANPYLMSTGRCFSTDPNPYVSDTGTCKLPKTDGTFYGAKPIDFNADGFVDLSYLVAEGSYYYLNFLLNNNGVLTGENAPHSNSSERLYFSNDNTPEWHIIDANGDGYQDVLLKRKRTTKYTSQANPEQWFLYQNSGKTDHRERLFTPVEFDLPTFENKALVVAVYDYDGDGLADVIAGRKDGTTYGYRKNNGNGFDAFVTLHVNGSSRNQVEFDKSIYGDFNGDGKVDRIYKSRPNYTQCDPGRTCTVDWRLNGSFISTNMINVVVGDINGDGLSDLVYEYGVHNKIRTRYATGKGFTDGETLSLEEGFKHVQLVDINADSRADLVYYIPSTRRFKYHLSTANGFSDSELLDASVSAGTNVDQVFVVDINGDGLNDISYVDISAKSLKIIRGQSQPDNEVNKVSSIVDGYGQSTAIKYRTMLDKTVYQVSQAQDSPFYTPENLNLLNWGRGSRIFNLLSPMSLVASTENRQQRVNYKYYKALLQGGGRGFLGFGHIESRYYKSGSEFKTTTSYRQDFPFTGMAEVTFRYYGDISLGSVINKLKLERTIAPFQPVIEKVTENNSSISSASLLQSLSKKITQRQYDLFGNITQEQVTTTDYANSNQVTTQVVDNEYGSTDEYKRFGRLTKTTVTHGVTGQNTIMRESEFTYLSNLLLENEIIEPNGGNELYLQTHYNYDSLGNVIKTSVCSKHFETTCGAGQQNTNDPLSIHRSTVNNYDAQGRYLISSGNDLFIEARFKNFNAFGQPQTILDANNKAADVRYDDFGNEYFKRDGTGSSQHTTKAWSSDSASIAAPSIAEDYFYVIGISAQGAPSKWQYINDNGQMIAEVSQGFSEDIYQGHKYDAYGRKTHESIPSTLSVALYGPVWVRTGYDVFDRVISTTTPERVTQFTYDNRVTSSTVSNAAGAIHTFSQSSSKQIDAQGRLLYVIDNDNQRLDYTHDAMGNLLTVTGVDQQVTTNQYDAKGYQKEWMNDPDSGEWHYSYNALGELVSQTDAKQQTISYTYDALGRTLSRTDAEGTAQWRFIDTRPHLLKQETTTGYVKQYQYDDFGRQIQTQLVLNAEQQFFVESQTYDQFGRVFQKFDASGDFQGIRYHYNDRGYVFKHQEAREGMNGEVYYTINAMNALGQITDESLGNGAHVVKHYSNLTGKLNGLAGSHQNQTYSFDGLGNLKQRINYNRTVNGQALTEEFDYDSLNRLETVQLNGIETLGLTYEGNGNILSKSNVEAGARYQYATQAAQCNATTDVVAGPHALTQVGQLSYCYDANGNQTRTFSGTNQTRAVSYTSFDKVSAITANNETTRFTYGADRNRYKRENIKEGKTRTSFYFGNIELNQNELGTGYDLKRYIAGYGLQTHYASTGVKQLQYLLKDHLGSIDVVLNDSNAIVGTMSFGAFGERRAAENWSPWSAAQFSNKISELRAISIRGFTGHEHVDHANIIHMNGRIYDSYTGRFMQADPMVQAPENGQNLNRYSYVLNNPLSYTDPSGYFFSKLWDNIKPFVGVIVGVALGAFCGGCTAPMIGALAGAAGAAANGGNIVIGAFVGAFSAVAFGQIGSSLPFDSSPIANVFAKGIVGAFTNGIQGGELGHGFLSAGFGGVVSGNIMGIGGGAEAYIPVRTLIAAIAGGTISRLTGGKFANGATTAGFAHLFNAERVGSNKTESQSEKNWDKYFANNWNKFKDMISKQNYSSSSRGGMPRRTAEGLLAEAAGATSVPDYNITTDAEWNRALAIASLVVAPISAPFSLGLGAGAGYHGYRGSGDVNAFSGTAFDTVIMGASFTPIAPVSNILGAFGTIIQAGDLSSDMMTKCYSPYKC